MQRCACAVCPTSWPRSTAHSLADWPLASTMTLNMVQMDCGTRKSVALLLRCSLASKAARVLQRGRGGGARSYKDDARKRNGPSTSLAVYKMYIGPFKKPEMKCKSCFHVLAENMTALMTQSSSLQRSYANARIVVLQKHFCFKTRKTKKKTWRSQENGWKKKKLFYSQKDVIFIAILIDCMCSNWVIVSERLASVPLEPLTV